MSELEGTTLGPYTIIRLLGRGGMARVYLAHDVAQDREVAIKVVHADNEEYLERFWREISAIEQLEHEHILPAYDYGTEEHWHYLVMPHIEGGTLRQLIKHGPLRPAHAGELLYQLADALQFAHDRGIIHRDIKPSNILMRDDHYSYLADFGLAKSLENSHEMTLTQSGTLLGTPEYMAPDLAEGPATASSDIYAMGVVLYQMLTGRLPFTAETPIAVYWKQLRERPHPPSHLRPDLSPAIDHVVMRALAKHPAQRYQSPKELADEFQVALIAPETLLSEDNNDLYEGANYASGELENLSARLEEGDVPVQVAEPPLQHTPHTTRERLVLPDNPMLAPTSVTKTRDDRRTPFFGTNAPSGEHFSRDSALKVVRTSTTRTTQQKRLQHARKRRNRALAIILIGLLVTVVLPMAFIYYIFVTHQGGTHTPKTNEIATPNIASTSQISSLDINATATAAPIATVTSATPLLNTSLVSNDGGNWSESAGRCVFTNGGYHVLVQQTDYLQPCPLRNTSFSDGALQVDSALLSGNNAGMLLRVQGEQFYDFEISSQGTYFFRRHDIGLGASYVYLLQPTSSAAIKVGQSNTLLVIAQGATFKFYINGSFVGETRDSFYSSGQVALVAGTLAPQHTGEGVFNNFKLYKL